VIRLPLLIATNWSGEIDDLRLRLEYRAAALRRARSRAPAHATTQRMQAVRR
jgi:hypothetical protein